MGLFTFLILFSIICWDILNLKRINSTIVHAVFSRLNFIMFAYVMLIGLLCYVCDVMTDEVIVFFIAGILPVYLYGRDKIVCQLKICEWDQRDKYCLICDFLYVVIMWLFSALIFSLMMYNFGSLFPQVIQEIDEVLYTTVFSTIVIIYLINRSVQSIDNQGFWFHVGMGPNTKSKIVTFVLPAVIGLIFAFSSTALVLVRPEQPDTPLSAILDGVTSPFSVLLFLFSAIIMAPFIEEIIFRGYFYNMLTRIGGRRLALYCISLSFGCMHVGQYWGDWVAISVVMILGFALTIMRGLSGTTLSSIIMHYAYNGGVALISLILILRDNPM